MGQTCSMKLLLLIFIIELIAMWPAMFIWFSIDETGIETLIGKLIGGSIFISLIYVLILSGVLNQLENKGGFFMYNDAKSYECLMTTTLTLLLLWLVGCFFSMVFMMKYFVCLGLFLLLDGMATATLPLSLWLQKGEYDKCIDKTVQSNLEEGRELTDDQAHTLYQMQVHKHKIEHPEEAPMGRGMDKLDDGRAKAIMADNYFKIQKWMHDLEKLEATQETYPLINQIYTEMARQCETFIELSPGERQKIQQVVKMDCLVVPDQQQQCSDLPIDRKIEYSRLRRQQNRTAFHLGKSHHQMVLQKLGENPRSSRVQSYMDLRRDSDAPPSYKSYEISGSERRSSFL